MYGGPFLRCHAPLQVGILCSLIGAWTPSAAAPPLSGTADEFFDLPLTELLSLETTSVAKKSQPVSQAAAAVFVITADDLRRSGVSSIPDALDRKSVV
jgi:outer membrane receptor for ferrienterochelin and colicin